MSVYTRMDFEHQNLTQEQWTKLHEKGDEAYEILDEWIRDLRKRYFPTLSYAESKAKITIAVDLANDCLYEITKRYGGSSEETLLSLRNLIRDQPEAALKCQARAVNWIIRYNR